MLTPYSKKLNQSDAIHLLRRCTFSIDWKTILLFTNLDSNAAVDLLFENGLKNAAPKAPSWELDEFEPWWRLPAVDQQKVANAAYEKVYFENYELKRWWIEEMTLDKVSIREKMTLFWHGHFTTKFAVDDVMPAQIMFIQNKNFRKNHQGNFRALLENIAQDGAMLIYLNGNKSTKKSPNENFSRELLELYTMGIGHYTEDDVKEGARVFTGWKVNFFKGEFMNYPKYKPFLINTEHDNESKNYLGDTIPKTATNSENDVIENEIKKLISIILEKRALEVSTFICEKLYRYFIFSGIEINNEVVATMAKTLRNNKWEIKPVLMELFKSSFFYEEAQKGIQIKTPAELIVGTTRHFDVKADWKEWVMVTMGQELLNPPNVAGWPGYRKWTDTRTFPFAVQQLTNFVWTQTNPQITDWVKQFSNKNDPKVLTEEILTLFFAKKPSEAIVLKYQNILLGGSPEYEWPIILSNIESGSFRIKLLLISIFKSPDYHLC